ncbi:MAG: hypothetical protein JSV93_00485, partial [Candidatus Omnitrophota bacterium]
MSMQLLKARGNVKMKIWQKKNTPQRFLFRTIASILIPAFFLCNIAPVHAETPIWQHSKPGIKLTEKVYLNGIKIPYDAGTAQEVFSTGGDEVVINIQDAHASLTAQYSIIKILENLVANYDLELIALEGAEGPIDISLLKTFPDPEIRKDIADYFVREGKMSAGEFFSIVSEKPIKLYGIENSQLYQANVNALNNLMEKKMVCLENIQGLLNTLKAIEPKIYSKDLLKLNENSILHQEGKLAFTKHWDFVEKLAKRNNIEIVIFENLSKLLKSIELEKGINFIKANEERNVLIDELSKVLPKRELEKLVLESLSFKMGKVSQVEFHQYLVRLARDIKLDPKPYSNLIKFTRYITIYEDIDLLTLFQEVEQFEDYIREKIFRNDGERTLYNLAKAARTIDKLFKISLNNNDYDFMKTKKRYFDRALISNFIKKSYAKYNLVFEHEYDLDIIFDGTEEAVEFYNIAQRRNKFMISNTIRVMKKHTEEFAALITGGFHSKGLTSIMKEKGLSYLVVMPKFEEGEQRPYLAVLTNERQPHEKLLLDTEEYILSAPALCWTDTPEEILKGLFGAYGLAYLAGKPIEPVVLEQREEYRNYLEEMERQRKGETSYKIPFTLEEFDETFGIDVEEGRAIGVKEGEGIVVREAKVDGKEVIVVRDYEKGKIKYQVALTKDREGKLTLDEAVPEEAIVKLREEGKTKQIEKAVDYLQKSTVDKVKQLLHPDRIGELTISERDRRQEILEAVITRLHYRAQQRRISPAELGEPEKLNLFIGALGSKGYLISEKWLERDRDFKETVLLVLNKIPLARIPALTPIASEGISKLSIYNLRYKEQAEVEAAQKPLTPLAKERVETVEKGVYDVTVYSLDEAKRQAEAHEARGAKALRLRIRFVPDEKEAKIIEQKAIPDLIDLMDIDKEILDAGDFIVMTGEEAETLSIEDIYNEYRGQDYEDKNIIIVNKHKKLTDSDKAFLGEKKIVVVQYMDIATGEVHYYALELWARGEV